MPWKEPFHQAINGLRGWVMVADPADKEVIVGIGSSMEQTFKPVGDDAPEIKQLGQLCLTALMTVYKGQAQDPAGVMHAISEGLLGAMKDLSGRTSGQVAEANKVLEALTGQSGGQSESAQQAQPEAQQEAEPAEEVQPEQPAEDSPDEPSESAQADQQQAPQPEAEGESPAQDEADQAQQPEAVETAGQPEPAQQDPTEASGDETPEGEQEPATEAVAAEGAQPEPQPEPQAEAQAEPVAAETKAETAEPEPAPEPQGQPAAAEAKGETAEPEPAPEPQGQPAAAEAKGEDDFGFHGPAIMPEDADPDLLGEFIVECLDHLNGAEEALLALESDPDDSDQINVVFRAFHTIKGTSGFLGLDRIQRLAHLAENLLDRGRDGEIRVTGGYADLALKGSDALRQMIEGLQGVSPGGEIVTPDTLNELLTVLSDPEGHGVSDESDTQPLRLGEILVGQGAATKEQIEQAVEDKPQDKLIGQQLVEKKVAKAGDVAKAVRSQKASSQPQPAAGAGVQTEATIRVATDRLDSLINMVGELVIAQSMVQQDPNVLDGSKPRLSRNVSHSGKIIRELQDLSMSLRMVPLKGTFQKMARLVRDLGKKAGKSVHFVSEGEDTEIDRNMVEVLNDPLVHMIRNSCDHGVESAEDRVAAGKEPTGTVKLRAYHSAGNVVIELVDDGKGLDKERILKKAIERGVVDPGKELNDQEIFSLIFAPGFSTADQITDVSGRGVGMDVVKKNIESIRGRIEVNSIKGQGTTFTLRLPLTMAITDAMLLRVGCERYLLPTVSIEQSFRPEKGAISTVTGRGEMVLLRGELLPVFRLHEMYGVADGISDVYEGLLIAIESEGKRCALMVDELLGQQQVVIKTLGSTLKNIPGVAGGAILGDGRVGLILDAAGLMQLAHGESDSADLAVA